MLKESGQKVFRKLIGGLLNLPAISNKNQYPFWHFLL